MKETREQYQARKRAQFEKRQAFLKRRAERINKRKQEALNEALATYAKNTHITPADAKRMKADDLISLYLDMDSCADRHEIIAVEIVRRAKKSAKADGITFNERKPNHGFSDVQYVNYCIKIIKDHIEKIRAASAATES